MLLSVRSVYDTRSGFPRFELREHECHVQTFVIIDSVCSTAGVHRGGCRCHHQAMHRAHFVQQNVRCGKIKRVVQHGLCV